MQVLYVQLLCMIKNIYNRIPSPKLDQPSLDRDATSRVMSWENYQNATPLQEIPKTSGHSIDGCAFIPIFVGAHLKHYSPHLIKLILTKKNAN